MGILGLSRWKFAFGYFLVMNLEKRRESLCFWMDLVFYLKRGSVPAGRGSRA